MPTTLSSTLSYNQWIMPLAMKCGDYTYFTGVKSTNGDWYVQRQDSSGNILSKNLEAGSEDDDHNAPCVLARPSKDIHVFFARHNASQIVNHYKGAPNSTPANFTDEGNIYFPSNVTYAQALDYQDDIYLMCRSGGGKWQFRKSDDWGDTWGSAQEFIDFGTNPYPIFREVSTGVYQFAIAPNPVASYPYLAYGEVDLSTGNITSGGSTIGNLDGTNLPLELSDFEQIPDVTNRNDQHIRLWDVGKFNGKNVIVYSKWEQDGGENESRLMFAIQDDTDDWRKVDIEIGMGQVIYSPTSSHYEGGAAFDRNGNNYLFVAWESAGTWKLKKHTIATDFSVGSGAELESESDSTAKLIRPVPVVGRNTLMYMRATAYTHYSNYSSGTRLTDYT